MRYILVGQTPVPEPDPIKWANWMESLEARIVARTEINGYLVSTIFLGIDHNFGCKGPPILFETMVFKGSYNDLICERCSTWSEAEEQHKEIVGLIRKKGNL